MAPAMHGGGGGAIAAGHPLTARAGADVLVRGGNACDALVAAAAASWVCEPTVSGACGGGFLVYRDAARGRTALLDFFVAVPGLGLRRPPRPMDAFDVEFGTAVQTFHIGIGSSAVPGTLAGVGEAHRRFGSLPWSDLLAPAIALCSGVEIIPAHDRLHAILEPVLTSTDAARSVFAPAGVLLREGERIAQPELGATLARLAEAGADDLYRGRLAAELAAFSRDEGGAITAEDLAAYRVIARRPLELGYRGHRLTTNPPPSGGILLAYALALSARLPAAPGPLSPRWMRTAAAVLREAEARRGTAFARALVRGGARRLLAAEALDAGEARVREALAGRAPALVGGHAARGTSHISVVDARGNAAAMTSSTGCGSGVFLAVSGLHLNNMLGEEDLTGHGAPRAGVRLTSMMAPTLIEGRGWDGVIGSSGSARIRSSLYRIVTALVDHDLDPRTAVDLPRVHPSATALDCEYGFPDAALDAVEAEGEAVVRWPDRSIYFGGAQVAVRRGATFAAAGDARRGGDAVVVA